MNQIKKLPSLKIGNLEINPPFVQGGMGVRVSMAGLASAVANEGCVGTIASVGLDKFQILSGRKKEDTVESALREEIQRARNQTKGTIGVNIMVALSNYEELVRAAIEEDVDVIISGAGMPTDLPKFLSDYCHKKTMLVPIVSHARALNIICEFWKEGYNKVPDAVIVEGPKAGGHLGFKYKELVDHTSKTLEQITLDVIKVANTFSPPIPVIAAGGIFDGKDIARFLNLGAAGVQMATRFVCTDECDVHDNFKQAYVKAKKSDITIINSPVGYPGRALRNAFVERIFKGETIPYTCKYHCLKSCDPKKVPYCIAKALLNASEGDIEEGLIFVGENVDWCNEIIPVKELVNKLTEETLMCLKSR